MTTKRTYEYKWDCDRCSAEGYKWLRHKVARREGRKHMLRKHKIDSVPNVVKRKIKEGGQIVVNYNFSISPPKKN